MLLLEEQEGSVNFKIGVMLMKPGQKTDDEMLSNGKYYTKILKAKYIPREGHLNVENLSEKGDEKWDRFISLLGDKIRLRGWNRFRGGLDVKGNIHISICYNLLHNKQTVEGYFLWPRGYTCFSEDFCFLDKFNQHVCQSSRVRYF